MQDRRGRRFGLRSGRMAQLTEKAKKSVTILAQEYFIR
jgi:hypothetical protein